MLSLTNTYSIPVSVGVPLSIWTPIIGIHVDIGAHYEHRWNETNLTLGDIDGDGNVDQILRANNRIFARVNDNGKANLLRTITGPTGGVITIGYAREGNHITPEGSTVQREMPTNRWVMASVTATGPHASSYTTTFDYASSGNYDRVEREFYGFGTVIARRSDGARSETYFHNQDYYRRGTAYEQRAFSASGMVLGRSVSQWSAPTPGLAPRAGRFYPARTSQTSYLYNGATANLAEFSAQSTTSYTYDGNHRLIEIFEPRESGVADDRRTQIDYYVNTARWIIAVREVRLLDSSNSVIQRQTKDFDSLGQVRWVENLLVGGVDPATGTPWDGSAGRNPKVSFKYDSFGNVSTVTDPTGFQRSVTYDPVTRSRPVSITDSFGYSTHTAWNYGFGAPTISTDSNGVQREVRYDQFGRVKEVYGAYEFGTATPTSSYSYALGSGGPLPTALWAQSSTIDPSHPGETIDAIVFVDGLGRTLQSKREITVELASGTVETGYSVSGLTEYDSVGRTRAVHQPSYAGPGLPLTTLAPMPASSPETVTYDHFGRVKTYVQPNGDTTSFDYGFAPIAGVLRSYVAVTDAKLRTRTAFSDLSGNVVLNRQSVSVGGTPTTVETQYFYDLLDRLVRVRDAADNDTIATYDSLGSMTSLTNADTGLVEYQYTLGGDLGARITPTLRSYGQRISYTRDWHRLSKIEYPGGGNVTFTYGAPGAPFHSAGRVTTLSDRSGTQSFQYGRSGEVLWNSRTLVAFGTLADPTTTAMTFNYDSLGRTQSITYPDGEKVEYEYDHGGNLRHVASADRTYVDEIRYDHFGRRRRVRNGNGTESVFTYDAVMQRLSQLDTTTSLGATALQSLRYRYDSVGLIDRIENAIPTGPMRGYSLRKFQYDENDQLTHATGELHDASGDSRRFSLDMAYDAIGRITQMNQLDQVFPSGGGAPTTVSATSRNNAYVYSSPRVHAATQVGADQYWYDQNGNQYYKENPISGDWRYLAWDEEDRLSYAFRPSSTAGFQYDAGGARTHKTDYSATTLYPSAYVTIRNGTEVTKHIWAGGQRVGSVVRPEPSKPTEHAYWVHNDHLGGGHYVTTKVGAVYEQAERLPFGESWVEQRAGTDRVSSAFAGSAHDEESGLNYHGARYYDAREARWTGRDPAIEENMAGGGVLDPRNLGLYTYAFNSPVSYWDPDGRQTVGPTPSGNPSQSGIAGSLCDAGATAPGCDGGHAPIVERPRMEQPQRPGTGGTTPTQQGESAASRAVRTGINGWHTMAGGGLVDRIPSPHQNPWLAPVWLWAHAMDVGRSLPGAVFTAITGRDVRTGAVAGNVERGAAVATVVLTAVGLGAESTAIRAAVREISYLRPLFTATRLSQEETAALDLIAAAEAPARAAGATAPEAVFSAEISGDCYIQGEIWNGVLTTVIRSRGPGRTPGWQLWQRMWDAIGSRVRVIRGTWTYETNLEAYNAARVRGLTREAAAADTWTGRQAARLGFTRVQVLADIGASTGHSTRVEVHFLRP